MASMTLMDAGGKDDALRRIVLAILAAGTDAVFVAPPSAESYGGQISASDLTLAFGDQMVQWLYREQSNLRAKTGNPS